MILQQNYQPLIPRLLTPTLPNTDNGVYRNLANIVYHSNNLARQAQQVQPQVVQQVQPQVVQAAPQPVVVQAAPQQPIQQQAPPPAPVVQQQPQVVQQAPPAPVQAAGCNCNNNNQVDNRPVTKQDIKNLLLQ